jgi:hypothetical protein
MLVWRSLEIFTFNSQGGSLVVVQEEEGEEKEKLLP